MITCVHSGKRKADASLLYYVFLFLSLLVLAALVGSVICLLVKKRKPSALMVTAAVAAAICLLRFPARMGEVSLLESLLLCVLDAMRFFTMALEYDLQVLPADFTLSTVYQFTEIFLWFLAPVCTASFMYMLFRTFLRQLWLNLQPKRPVCYFSSLNEKSFTLAKSLYADWEAHKKDSKGARKPALVFCQVDTGDENDTELQFRADAEELGAIFFSAPIHSIHLRDPLKQQIRIFLMDQDEESNILTLLKMQNLLYGFEPAASEADRENHRPSRLPNSDIFVFSTLESSELLFDKFLTEFPEAPKGQRSVPKFNLHLIDEAELIAQKLLLDYPLFSPTHATKEKKAISVLVVGGGMLGQEIMRTAMICGVTDSYPFEIQVIDQNGRAAGQHFRHRAPYLYGKHEVIQGNDGIGAHMLPKFHTADVQSAKFDEILERHCQSSNYIVITTGNDELNITTALHLQRWYARQDIAAGNPPSRPPMIFAAIRNTERYSALESLQTPQLRLFGRNTDIFSTEGILNRPLDNAAALFNMCYDGTNDKLLVSHLCKSPQDRQNMRYELFQLTQVNLYSNQMAALHSLYKFQDLLHQAGMDTLLLDYRKSKKDTQEVFARLCGLTDGKIDFRKAAETRNAGCSSLIRLEHRRWNLFQILDGWEPFPLDMIKPCQRANCGNTQKYVPVKLHGCILPFAKLPALSKVMGKSDDHFIKYDAAMCCASLFAWLDLEADPVEAQKIRDTLLKKSQTLQGSADPSFGCVGLIEYLCDIFAPKEKAPQKTS